MRVEMRRSRSPAPTTAHGRCLTLINFRTVDPTLTRGWLRRGRSKSHVLLLLAVTRVRYYGRFKVGARKGDQDLAGHTIFYTLLLAEQEDGPANLSKGRHFLAQIDRQARGFQGCTAKLLHCGRDTVTTSESVSTMRPFARGRAEAACCETNNVRTRSYNLKYTHQKRPQHLTE
eukprot:3878495-Rhodomonas_salina.3